MNRPVSPDLVVVRPTIGLVDDGIEPPFPNLGTLLVAQGKIDAADVGRILSVQRAERLRFGDAAIKLRLVSAADVEAAVAQQFGQYLPAGDNTTLDPALVVAHEPRSAETERYRALRSQLVLRWFDVQGASCPLAVLGCDRGEDAALVVANLAVSFAQLGRRTLALDANLRAPRLHRIFGVETTHGLSTLLAARSDFEPLQPLPRLEALFLLPAGPVPPNPQELLLGAFSQVIRGAAGAFDVVLAYASACDGTADFEAVAAACGGTLLVAASGRTSLTAATALAARLRALNAPLVGAVLDRGQ